MNRRNQTDTPEPKWYGTRLYWILDRYNERTISGLQITSNAFRIIHITELGDLYLLLRQGMEAARPTNSVGVKDDL